MLGKKGDKSGSGLALVILARRGCLGRLETALVGGGQEAGQEHSEWVEPCSGSSAWNVYSDNVSPLTPGVTCDVVTTGPWSQENV